MLVIMRALYVILIVIFFSIIDLTHIRKGPSQLARKNVSDHDIDYHTKRACQLARENIVYQDSTQYQGIVKHGLIAYHISK